MPEYPGEVRFHPWVGKQFSDPTLDVLRERRARLLVLGESHYGNEVDDWDQSSTKWIVNEWALNKRHAFFTRIALTLLPADASPEDRDAIRDVYQNIAFHNYVQTLVPESRRSPDARQFRDSFAAFKEVVQILQPTHVWMLGKRLWNNTPSDGFTYSENVWPQGQRSVVGRYDFGGADFVCFATNHPSGGYATGRWRKFVHAVLASSDQNL